MKTKKYCARPANFELINLFHEANVYLLARTHTDYQLQHSHLIEFYVSLCYLFYSYDYDRLWMVLCVHSVY